MPKRKCAFNKALQEKYPLIKVKVFPSDVLCEKCTTQFSVSHGGGSDIEQHLKSEKHNNADRVAATNFSLQKYFKNTNTPTSKDLEIATAEGVWVYHTVQENHSFRSNDCASKFIQSCFDSKFRCARTKTEAIIKNVFAQKAIDDLNVHLTAATWVSISTDASNHGSQKLFPILVRYFLPYKAVQVKLLEFKELPGEKSDIVVSYVADVLREYNILHKIVTFCGDNTNCNFGGSERRGKNNVFAKLNHITGRSLIGIGCVAHVIHNAIKCATD